MQKSEAIGQLAAALALAQKEIKPAIENATNPFLKNKYADLGAVVEAIREPFAKNGLSYVQFPVSADPMSEAQAVGVETLLMHSSGEWLSDVIFLPLGEEKGKSQAQVLGSIITYLRRYSIAAMAGVYSDEDTDGQQQRTQQTQCAAQPQPEPQPTTPAPVISNPLPAPIRTPSTATRESFFAFASEHKVNGEAAKIATKYTQGKNTNWTAAMQELQAIAMPVAA